MAYQIPRIKFNWRVLKLKPSRFCFQTLIVGLCVVALSICLVKTATCPPSVPTSAATTTEQYSFSGYTKTYTVGVVVSPVSNSLYYLYVIFTTFYSAAVRKVDASGSQTWIASFAFYPLPKSLSVDAAEQSMYLVIWVNPLVVLKLAASDGSIISRHEL